MAKAIVLAESRIVNISLENAYQKLIEPAEQVKWNSLYLEAKKEPKDEIKDGTIMTGNFKGSGKVIVEFQNVKPNQEFTHYSKMKLFNFINLGEFHHSYKVVAKKEKTEIIQTVSFEPKGLGKLLKNSIVKSFKKRLPESFDEFLKYVEVKI